MIEGESGILACCPKDERPLYKKSERKLVWPNGVTSLIFTADEPERLRGKQHEKLWADELGAWRYPESWDQAQFGLRLGRNPQAVVTTTPRPTQLVKELAADPNTIVTRGSTYDNQANLAPKFLQTIVAKYEGTRLGRQELHADILTDNPRALWKRSQVDALRITSAQLPRMKRIVVGVDPAVTNNETSDETGIVVVGLGEDNHGYVLDDRSLKDSVSAWGQAAVNAYRHFSADRVVAEVNNGGDLVEVVVRQADANVSYKAVRASRGKQTRAEPVSALYEQGRIHHVGAFATLEDQMCDYDPVTATK
jgi:phage terminase large subunit-like protein